MTSNSGFHHWCMLSFSLIYLLPNTGSAWYQAMSGEIYDALTKALVTPDPEGINCYPVRTSAAGALASLLDVIKWLWCISF